MPSRQATVTPEGLVSPEAGLQAGDLRSLAALHYRELGKILDCLHDIEGVKAVKARVEANQSFLRALAMIPDNGFVIAVTGLQGVGKSTLANALLGISGTKGALPEGLGRCEKVPVLVRALLPGERSQAHALPLTSVGNTAANLVPVDSDKALCIALGEALDDGREAILVDYPLSAPPEPLLPPLVYLLILPGYEKKSAWGDLAMASMLLADRAVFVLDGSALASQSNKALLAGTMARFGGEGLAVVVSKADRPGQKPEDYTASLNALEVGHFSPEVGNLFFTGVRSNDPAEWQGVEALRDGLFYGLDQNMMLARASRTRQLAAKLRDFAEDDMEMLIDTVREQLERTQTNLAPNQRIYSNIQGKITRAREKAEKAARDVITNQVEDIFNKLVWEVERKIYTEASGFTQFVDGFNPFQDYKDQQDVRLNNLMRDMVNDSLAGIPAAATTAALKAFRDHLPESMFREQEDRQWTEVLTFTGKIDPEAFQAQASAELTAAMKPIASLMVEILEKAAKTEKLDKATLAEIAKNVLGNSGIKNLRRGMVALGLMDAGLIGVEIGEGTAASAATAISAPLAAAMAVVLVVVATAFSLRAAKNYKVNAQKTAGYLVSSSKEPIKKKMLESLDPILDWFQDGLDRYLRTVLGLRRSEDAQYRLAVQCERLSVLRSATLKVLAMR